MGGLVLGLDCGLTVTKAVVYDEEGSVRSSASARVAQNSPQPRWVERDVDEMWRASAEAIRSALQEGGIDPREILSVGVTAHGDGLYLLDEDGRPTRPGILSLDSRAHSITERWEAEGRSQRILDVTGQIAEPLSPAPLLVWMIENEPGVVERTHWALTCKDVVKLCLTGEVSADPTEASTSFCDVRTQTYSEEALAVYGLEGYGSMLAPVVGCTEIAGTVTAKAAELTGLAEGTPVVSGLHDVDASAIGMGCVKPGQLAMVAGTSSINEVIADRPVTDGRWFARNFVRPGQWMHMSLSLASAGNLEWFVQRLCRAEYDNAEASGEDPFAFVEHEVSAVADDPGEVLFLPFLYGSPHGAAASGTFLGMRGWHDRGHLLRAVMEGVVFNHRTHVDALRDEFEVSEGRLTGGAVKSGRWAQMFADALGIAGMHDSLDAASAASVRVTVRLEPDDGAHERLDEKYGHYRRVIDALEGAWEASGGAG